MEPLFLKFDLSLDFSTAHLRTKFRSSSYV